MLCLLFELWLSLEIVNAMNKTQKYFNQKWKINPEKFCRKFNFTAQHFSKTVYTILLLSILIEYNPMEKLYKL